MVAATVDPRSGLWAQPRAWVPATGGAPARRPVTSRRLSVTGRRCQLVGAFAGILGACAVWAHGAVGPGAADRPGSGPLVAPGAGPTRPVAARVRIVQPGDTVGGIAHRLQPAGDIRPLVDRLSGQLRGGALQVGERLELP